MIPWTLIIALAERYGPEVVDEVHRLYTNWKANGTEPTASEWEAVNTMLTSTNATQAIETEINAQASDTATP